MSIFLLTFLSIYGGMHAYLFWKVSAAFPSVSPWRLLMVAFLVVMMFLPFASRRAEASGALAAARVLYLVSWCWMVGLFWFCVVGVGVEGWNAVGRSLHALRASGYRMPLVDARSQVVAAAVLIAIGFAWGCVEARHVRLRSIRMRSSRLPPGSPPLRIVHISDLHLSLHQGEEHARKVVGLVNSARPDIVVCTGDLADSPEAGLGRAAELLRSVDPPLGKFACTGNHEFYHGIESAEAFHRAAGFVLLRGRATTPGGRLMVAGVDDPAGARVGADCSLDEAKALGSDPGRPFTVLLKHRPVVSPDALGRFDLQLSGHTHGGQVFPFGWIVRFFFRNVYGWRELRGGGALYVTSGAGSWGPPVRVFAPPEVVLIVVEPSSH